MRIIISRKGFDMGSGGCPSPILPDGRMISLPIPDKCSGLRYQDLNQYGLNYGDLVSQLSRGKQRADYRAHLDPDLSPEALPRESGWKPVFGQMKQAQGHLRNQGVREGDLFLFFGLYQAIKETKTGLVFDRDQPKLHMLWGWMQIGEVLPIHADTLERIPWASYHPHFVTPGVTNNTLYIAADKLSLDGKTTALPGAGVFPRFEPRLVLTADPQRAVSHWRLPGWFYSPDRPLISYLSAQRRWQIDGDSVLLDTSGRWQEAVMDADHYPEAESWALQLINSAIKSQ